jgi:tRNA 2-thiouridine synthesizing protein B
MALPDTTSPSILHTVRESPYIGVALGWAIRTVGANSSLLLIEDGVYASLYGIELAGDYEAQLAQLAGDARLYALAADLSARGVAGRELVPGLQLVDYRGFVELAVSHDRVQSWI